MDKTIGWLADNNCDYYMLYMRKDCDYRQDFITKQDIYNQKIKNKFDVLFVIEDRKQDVDMWRKNGLVCLQCAEGKF
jgi:hypothetical protein